MTLMYIDCTAIVAVNTSFCMSIVNTSNDTELVNSLIKYLLFIQLS